MKNEYQHNDDGTTHIFVESNRKNLEGEWTIVVDTEDWKKVKDYRWSLSGTPYCRYPYAKTAIPHPDGGWNIRPDNGQRYRRNTKLKLHHLIMGKPQKGMVIDHINHNGLDNRKENLRFVTQAQNQQNSRSSKNSSSQYKGVDRRRAGNKWRARIMHKGKETSLGLFTCEHQAALAYNKKAVELWGENALLNKVEKQ